MNFNPLHPHSESNPNTRGTSPPSCSFKRRVEKLRKKGYHVLHANRHLEDRATRDMIVKRIVSVFQVKEEGVVFLGTGTKRMQVTSWAVRCEGDLLRIYLPHGSLAVITSNGEQILLSTERVHPPSHSLVVARSAALTDTYPTTTIEECIRESIMRTTGGNGLNFSIRRKNESGNWLIDNLGPEEKRIVIEKGLTLTLDVAKHYQVVDPAAREKSRPPNEPPVTEKVPRIPSAPIPTRSAPWKDVGTSPTTSITVLKNHIVDLEDRVAHITRKLQRAEEFIEKVLSVSNLLSNINPSLIPLPSDCNAPVPDAVPTNRSAPVDAPTRIVPNPPTPTLPEAHVLGNVPRATPGSANFQKSPKLPAVKTPKLSATVDNAQRDATPGGSKPQEPMKPVPTAQPPPSQHALNVLNQTEMILKHKDPKRGLRQYLVKDTTQGTIKWKSANAYPPDSLLVLLYEISVAQVTNLKSSIVAGTIAPAHI